MPKKTKRKANRQPDLWVAAKYTLKGPAGDRAWDNRTGGPLSNSRFLELADIALGTKRPEAFKKRKAQTKQEEKSEPYIG